MNIVLVSSGWVWEKFGNFIGLYLRKQSTIAIKASSILAFSRTTVKITYKQDNGFFISAPQAKQIRYEILN